MDNTFYLALLLFIIGLLASKNNNNKPQGT